MSENMQILISQKEIEERIKSLAVQINTDYAGKEVLLVCVLRGAVMFAMDLAKALNLSLEIDFLAVSSYGCGTASSGSVKIIKDLDCNIEGKHVLLIEDIVDTGLTLTHIAEMIKMRNPKSFRVCALLSKPERRMCNIEADYTGFTIEDKFVVGYGLDYNQKYRNLPYICIL